MCMLDEIEMSYIRRSFGVILVQKLCSFFSVFACVFSLVIVTTTDSLELLLLSYCGIIIQFAPVVHTASLLPAILLACMKIKCQL